jgi:hypothetical protein
MANVKNPCGTRDAFWPLDNSAVFMASISGRLSPYMFRVSCELDDIIDLPSLEAALSRCMPRFPSFATELRVGFFWYYLEPLSKPLRVTADTRYPVEYLSLRKQGRHLVRVRAYATRISCEFHHLLTDGTGAIEFLRSLVAEYLTLRGVACDDWEGIRDPRSSVLPGELVDSYAELALGKVPLPDPLSSAFHLSGACYRGLAYRVTSGTLSVAETLALARARGVTLTELLAACYLAALQDIHESKTDTRWKPIRIQVPVNIRRFYQSETIRNFFLFITVTIDRRLGHWEFDEILERVRGEFRVNLTRKELSRQIRRNGRWERSVYTRLVPLAVKTPVLKLVARLSANRPFSGSVSNLQAVRMPVPFAARIRRFDVLPSRCRGVGANMGVVSWNDTLSITVGNVLLGREFERNFFRRLSGLGLSVRVESNE